MHNEVIDVEIISETFTAADKAISADERESEPCPIDAIFREVDDTLTDFRVSAEVHQKLAEGAKEARELYQVGERIAKGVEKTLPRARQAWEKLKNSDVFLKRRTMMKRGM